MTSFLKKWARRAGRAAVWLLLFGMAVSLIGMWRVPAVAVEPLPDASRRIDEVTRMYPVRAARVIVPRTVEEITAAVRSTAGPIAIGGGRYSMGGQTATPDGLQLDMREFRGVVALDTVARTITVRSGTRWREVQEAVDPHGLAVKIMQTYNTFTVGGALSVNAHGRYVGQGPLVRSVRAITLVLADGRVVTASPRENADLFYGAIGGYGALGVIADVTLDLAVNTRVRRFDTTLAVADYLPYFRRRVQADTGVIFHNADIYPPAFERAHAVSYAQTELPVTVSAHLQPPDQGSASRRFGYRMIASGRFGKWARRAVFDPMMFRGNPVTWRNYEASYDVSELEPASRDRATYVLQEYFVPVESVGVFVPRMRRVLQSHRVNAVNVSIRHALADPGTLLAWAPNEVFAFVLYYRQGTSNEDAREVGRWTRELIDAALASGGRYYLPYQPVATRAQFHAAYPRATELMALKRRVDPTGKFTNTLWDLYAGELYSTTATVTADRMPAVLPAEITMVTDTLRGYVRAEGPELLTHPEWDLVYSSEAYARWLKAAKKPSGFPYLKAVGTFWRGYNSTSRAARVRTPAGIGTHVMLVTIGLSTAVEYGIKGMYENTVGRLFELAMPAGGTDEDRVAAQVAEDYAALINQKGWYEFSFLHALGQVWRQPWTGAGFLRKWERRFFLTLEYGLKSGYATLIGAATGAGYAPDEMDRTLIVAGPRDSLGGTATAAMDRGYTRVTVPRYAAYRDLLLALSRRTGVRVAEINGNHMVTFTGTAARNWRPPARSRVVVAYAVPEDPARLRFLLSVEARDLLDVLRASAPALAVDHIYDY